MKKERLLKLAGVQLNEDFSDAEHYRKKGAEKEKFEGRTILVTDLYDGDVFGYLGNYRFVVSTPIWRDEQGPGHVDDDEVEVSDVDNSLSSKDVALLKRWTLAELNESKEEKYDADPKNYDKQIKEFTDHAEEIGLRAGRSDDYPTGNAFKMRDDKYFDIYFYYQPSGPADTVNVQYVLHSGKHYNFKIPKSRFMTFEKDEVQALHDELKKHQERYDAAVKVVKEMPADVKGIIQRMVQ